MIGADHAPGGQGQQAELAGHQCYAMLLEKYEQAVALFRFGTLCLRAAGPLLLPRSVITKYAAAVIVKAMPTTIKTA